MRFKSPNDLNESYKIPHLLKHKAKAPFFKKGKGKVTLLQARLWPRGGGGGGEVSGQQHAPAAIYP